MLKDALLVPLRQSEQRDSRRRRQRSQPALSAAAEPLPRKFYFRQWLSDDTRSGSLRRTPHDRGPRLRARPSRGYLAAVTQEPHPPTGWLATLAPPRFPARRLDLFRT